MRSFGFRWLILAGAVALAHCAPKPTEKGMDGKVKAKARLQLADGSTISRDDSEEYNPYLVQLSDGYLVLVFGSDRNGGLHNIFMAKSVVPYDGFSVPAFDTPVAVTASASPIDDPSPINFAATANGTSVDLYVNLHTASSFIRKGTVADPSAPDVGTFATITNTTQDSNTIIGINADGADLITTDAGGIAYLVNPGNANPSNAFGANLDYSTSATQVRFDNSGQNDAYMGSYYGSTFAATATDYFGPIFDFDISLAESGLSMGQMTTFYDGYSAYGDMVLFSANDGISSDIYVVTSHTAGMLWSMVAFFGFDTFLPPAPLADHWYDFETAFTCPAGPFPADVSTLVGGWNATACAAGVTRVTSSYNGSFYANFTGSPLINLGSRDVGPAFTISAWVFIPAGNCNSTICTIIANSSSTTTATGFRFVYRGNPVGTLQFITGNGSTTSTAESIVINNAAPFDIEDGFWHHVAITSTPLSGVAWIYLDGGLVSSTLVSETTFSTGPLNLYLGMMSDSQNAFLGRMDDVKIFSYELDPMSILALYLQ